MSVMSITKYIVINLQIFFFTDSWVQLFQKKKKKQRYSCENVKLDCNDREYQLILLFLSTLELFVKGWAYNLACPRVQYKMLPRLVLLG